jgi:hypothetical protein
MIPVDAAAKHVESTAVVVPPSTRGDRVSSATRAGVAIRATRWRCLLSTWCRFVWCCRWAAVAVIVPGLAVVVAPLNIEPTRMGVCIQRGHTYDHHQNYADMEYGIIPCESIQHSTSTWCLLRRKINRAMVFHIHSFSVNCAECA